VGGGSGSSGPTLQQQQLETEQALTTANLNLEENSQRKSILNAMQGTRVFRGSALSRAVAGNNDVGAPTGAPSKAQQTAQTVAPAVTTSLIDTQQRAGVQNRQVGATPAGGRGASSSAAPSGAAQAAYQAGYSAVFGGR
jgi:hypothetical protein